MNLSDIIIMTCGVVAGWSIAEIAKSESIQTAIIDNGQASHQELSQTKSNADVYNYAALSTSY